MQSSEFETKMRCSVLNCVSLVDSKNVVYFRYPIENRDLLQKWLSRIGRSNWHPTKKDTICSRHFKISDINHPMNKNIASLKVAAVPSIFPNRTANFQKTNMKQPPRTVRSNMVVRKQLDPNTPGSILLIPVNKKQNSTSVVAKPPVMIVSKGRSAGTTTVTVRSPPGSKRQVTTLINQESTDRIKDVDKKILRRPVLKICVNKKYNHKKNGRVREIDRDDSDEMVDQIEANTVIFKLDPVTREIVVLKKNETSDWRGEVQTEKKSRLEESSEQIETNRTNYKNVKLSSSSQRFQDKLAFLEKKQLEEREEINLLQKELSKLQNSSQKQNIIE